MGSKETVHDCAGQGPRPQEVRPPARPIVVWVGPYGFTQVAYGQNETAEMTGTTRQHIATQVREGKIKTIRIGRRVLVSAAEIARLMGYDPGLDGADDGGRAA